MHKPLPDNEYALDCKLCHNSMVLHHNIHTKALLFQFYKCKCVYADNHIIVRDKLTNESVVHRSKGMWHIDAAYSRKEILGVITVASSRYWHIIRYTGDAIDDAPLDLIVDEDMIDEYDTKHGDASEFIDRFSTNEGSPTKVLVRMPKSDAAMNHPIRLEETNVKFSAIMVWFSRLEYDTYL